MAQTDRGTITGTITDPAGAVVPGASVTALHKATGASVQSITTSTGNYTLPSLATGIYDLTIEANGFNKYIQEGIEVQVAQTARIDVTLKIGAATESVTVNADAPLLKTESAEQSQTLSGDRVNELPLTLTSAGIRNPIAFAQLQPGAYAPAGGNFTMQVNGVPSPTSSSSYKTLMDGQDMTSGIDPTHLSETQPSVEALQEMTLQASNFAAEFGQVGGGLVNFTSKSGTNQFHGSGYDYWTNRVLNAGQAYTVSPSNPNGHIKPVNTNDNFDGSIGGPVIIPKIYNGKNRTFFFFNWDNFITHNAGSGYTTAPTLAMRNGDFSAVAASAPKSLGTEPDGTPIAQYEIFDPNSNYTYNGQVLRQPFPGNIIPMSRIDPVALKVQALIPAPTNSGLVNNLIIADPLLTHVFVPSLKLDHNINDKTRMSIYWGEWKNWVPKSGADGYPYPLSAGRNFISANHTIRVTFDRTITPTLLLHVGVGELRYDHIDSSPPATLNYDAVGQLGLVGSDTHPAGFPRLAGLSSSAGGGPTGFGPVNANDYYNDKPTATSSVTWVKGNHTFKFGEEWRRDIWEDVNTRGSQGIYNFSAGETGLPYVSSTTLSGGNLGFPYASFLLGQVDSATVSNLQDPQIRKIGLGFYAQDTWKVTRKLTLDYGIRYDYETVWHEIHGRFSSFEPGVVNPSAGGLLGGTAYPATCKCDFSPPYKFGFGPRLGVAYQLNHKTVIRGGFGVVYGRTSDSSYITNSPILGTGFNQLAFASPAFGTAEGLLKNGLSYTQGQINDASLNPGIVPYAGQLNPPPYYLTQQGGRPPRLMQWNVSLQREITRDLVAEVSYVGNRGAWLQSDSFIQINANSIQRLAAQGYNIANNPTVLSLLTSNWNSPQAVAAGIKPPYAGYPVTTVAQLLRPFPQFTSISTKWSANGDSWYDGLQAKLTQRLWHGLFGQAAFAYQGAWDTGIETANDITNRAANHDIQATSQPFVLSYGITYKTPAPGFTTNRFVREVLKDWTLSGFARDSSGMPIQSPAIQNNIQSVLFQPGGFMNRVPGVPLFTADLNCHCIDPTKQFVLNPAAWTNPAPGTFGNAAAYYNDYRQQRRPQEQFGIGRIFVLRERLTMQLRAEFYNVFNRTEMGTPTSTNSLGTQTLGPNGLTSGGFGWINYTALAVQPRNGQLLLRFNF
jgi:Carboxypeptidase regulatory-like domain